MDQIIKLRCEKRKVTVHFKTAMWNPEGIDVVIDPKRLGRARHAFRWGMFAFPLGTYQAPEMVRYGLQFFSSGDDTHVVMTSPIASILQNEETLYFKTRTGSLYAAELSDVDPGFLEPEHFPVWP